MLLIVSVVKLDDSRKVLCASLATGWSWQLLTVTFVTVLTAVLLTAKGLEKEHQKKKKKTLHVDVLNCFAGKFFKNTLWNTETLDGIF